MNTTTVVRQIRLGAHHRPTGKTRHFRGGKELSVPVYLQIVRISGDLGWYLLYLDDEWRELTDTYHESIEAALEQAKWEFGVKPEEWKCVGT